MKSAPFHLNQLNLGTRDQSAEAPLRIDHAAAGGRLRQSQRHKMAAQRRLTQLVGHTATPTTSSASDSGWGLISEAPVPAYIHPPRVSGSCCCHRTTEPGTGEPRSDWQPAHAGAAHSQRQRAANG